MIHELNNIVTEYEEIETYFKAMDITKEQREERETAAEDMWWVFLLLFTLIKTCIEEGNLDYGFIRDSFYESYGDIVRKYAIADEYIETYITRFVNTVLDTTWNNLDFANPDDNYWTSNERALEMGLNEANSVINYKEYKEAVKKGLKNKTWKAELDNKTRHDHSMMSGKTIGINETFKFPDCEMFFPHDEVNGTARQTVNCRCAVKYS